MLLLPTKGPLLLISLLHNVLFVDNNQARLQIGIYSMGTGRTTIEEMFISDIQ
jgi:hypothetical protein